MVPEDVPFQAGAKSISERCKLFFKIQCIAEAIPSFSTAFVHMDYVLDLFRASNHDLGHASLRLIEKMKSTYFHSRLASDLAQLTQHR